MKIVVHCNTSRNKKNIMKKILIPVVILLLFSCNNNSATEANDMHLNTLSTVEQPSLPSKAKFDTLMDGKQTTLYFIKNKNNLQAAVTNYGARMVGMLVPDKSDKLTDVVIGFDNIKDFTTTGDRYFGAIVGRYGNRIAKGKFTLDGKSYQLDLNNGSNTLHGGSTGIHSRVWDAVQKDSATVELTYVSKDGEEGYPGTVTVKATYHLSNENELFMRYEITTDKKTVINITNHNFWNLNGEGSGTINNHELMISAAKYTPVDSTLIPTGIDSVAGTPFDFTAFHKIGERVEVGNTQLKYGKGYDHNFVLNKGITASPELVATVKGDMSGIEMDILTTEPGLQFYGGNFMQGANILKSGARDDFRTAFCLETQHFPDSPNQPGFPSTILEKGATYKTVTVYKFK
jgi:aldose 1-epimerase